MCEEKWVLLYDYWVRGYPPLGARRDVGSVRLESTSKEKATEEAKVVWRIEKQRLGCQIVSTNVRIANEIPLQD